jgi:hypothetical protein
MIMKKDGVLFCDSWYIHLCQEMGDEEKSGERILYDDLREKWQFVDRGIEVDIAFCPFCGEELKIADTDAGNDCGEGECAASGENDHNVQAEGTVKCVVKCMGCAQDVALLYVPETNCVRSGECKQCKAEITFDVSA